MAKNIAAFSFSARVARCRTESPVINELRHKKTSLGFPTSSDINWAAQQKKMIRGLEFRMEELYYLCSENKGTDQLRCYSSNDLRQIVIVYMQRAGHHNESRKIFIIYILL